jgi:WD40 repeat protein
LDAEDALRALDAVLNQTSLTNVEEQIFRGTWKGSTYEQIAAQADYDPEYIKHVGYQLWQRLSEVFGEKVTKGNLQVILRRKARQLQSTSLEVDTLTPTKNLNNPAEELKNSHPRDPSLIDIPQKRQDWGEEINLSDFYGRSDEMTTLEDWVLAQNCRLVVCLGMGGIGKTSLVRQFAEKWQDRFEGVIWRSLRQAPPLTELLTSLLKFIVPDPELPLPESSEGKIVRLVDDLKTRRFLLILDNIESILWGGESSGPILQRAGSYRSGYEGYGELFRQLGEGTHQSCLLLTSREKPKEIVALEGIMSPVRSLALKGLVAREARPLLRTKIQAETPQGTDRLVNLYAGNPLALKIVASTIQELFDGDIEAFLQEGTPFFGDIGELLDGQFNRLSNREKQIMFWLAINQEPVSLPELGEDIAPFLSRRELLESLESLGRRPLIEKYGSRFGQQSVIMEYVTEQFIEQIYQEIVTETRALLNSHAILKAEAKDYIRESQIRLIVEPIVQKLATHFRAIAPIEHQLKKNLSQIQHTASPSVGYGAGNLINLLCHLKADFTGLDFSRLTIWQAYLRNVKLQQVNFAYANLNSTVFTETFGGILRLALSSDGAYLAISYTDCTIRLWRVADAKQLWIGRGHNSWIYAAAFSPDDRLIASGGNDTAIRLWDVATGECVKTFEVVSFGSINSLAFNPKNESLAIGDFGPNITILDIKTGSPCQTLNGKEVGRIWALAFSPDGRILASGIQDAHLWDVETGECIKTFPSQTTRIRTVAFSNDGTFLAVGSYDHTIKLWHLPSGNCLQTLHGHSKPVSSLAFSPDDSKLASSSYDQTLRLWQVQTGQCLQVLEGHTNLIWTLAYSPDGVTLVSGGDDYAVKFWDTQSGQCVKTWQGHLNALGAVSYLRPIPLDFADQPSRGVQSQSHPLSVAQTEFLLVSGSDDQIIRLWRMPSGECFQTLVGHRGRIISLQQSADGRTLFSGSSDCTAKLWDLCTGQCLRTFDGHTSWIWSIAYSSDGQLLATGSEDGTARLWTIDGQCLHVIQKHQGAVYAVALSPNAKTLATAGIDCTIQVWDLLNLGDSDSLQEHTNAILALTFSPDGHYLLSCSQDQTIKVWDLETRSCIRTFSGHQGGVWAIALSPDGQLLASGSEDRTIKLWEFESGQCLRTLSGHQNLIKSITMHPDAPIMVSSSLDETMKVWDLQTGECLNTLRVERPYEGMNITGTIGLTDAQKETLKALGAVEL